MKIKGFDKDLKCRGYQFEIGKTYEIKLPDGYELTKEDLCSDKVFHYCDSLRKVHGYYSVNPDDHNRFCEIEVCGKEVTDGNKCGSNKIKIIREIVGKELDILKGLTDENTGFFNRGKRKDNGEWVTGYYVFQRKRSGVFGQKISELDFDRHLIIDLRGNSHEVIPETVVRCTGLKDKNGKPIFEGDIIKTKKYGRDIGHSNVNNFDIFKVIYEPAVFRLKNVRRGFNLVGNGNDFEVIGNVMDNSELLEVER